MQPSEDRFITALNDLTGALRQGFITLCQRVERLEHADRANAAAVTSLTQDMSRLVEGLSALRLERLERLERLDAAAPSPARIEPGQPPCLRVIEGGGA